MRSASGSRRMRGALAAACALVASAAFGAGTAGAATFNGSNPAALNPADGGAPATSSIAVSGQGSVTGASIVLNGVTHTAADEFDLLLVSPGGVKSLLMSDACDLVNNLTLTLTDSAATPIPQGGGCASTSYRPADYVGGAPCEPDGADVFDPPAPAGIDADNFAAFNGGAANGAWSLYVSDDCPGGATGTVAGGWSLSLTTTDPPATTPKPKPKKCKKKKGKGKAGAAAKKCKKKPKGK